MMKRRVATLATGVTVLGCAAYFLNDYLVSGLEEEKSFTRNAMLAYRRNPKEFENRINRGMMARWSDMDLILQAAEADQTPGDWAKTAAVLSNLPGQLSASADPRAYCIIRRGGMTVVVALKGPTIACATQLLENFNPSASPARKLDWMSANVDHSRFMALIRN